MESTFKNLEECKKNHLKDKDSEIKKYIIIFRNITKILKISAIINIANMHEMYSYLTKKLNEPYKKITLIENYEKILIAMTPIIPHLQMNV